MLKTDQVFRLAPAAASTTMPGEQRISSQPVAAANEAAAEGLSLIRVTQAEVLLA